MYQPLLKFLKDLFSEWTGIGREKFFVHFDLLAKPLQLRTSSNNKKVVIKEIDEGNGGRGDVIVWERSKQAGGNSLQIKGNPEKLLWESDICTDMFGSMQEWTVYMNATGKEKTLSLTLFFFSV